MQEELYLDRDYIQDNSGDLFQVMGSFHSLQGIFAIPRYKIVSHFTDKFYWIQKKTLDKFERIPGKFSSKWVNETIQNHHYKIFSNIFQHNMICVPLSEIKFHYKPQLRLQELFHIFQTGSFEQKKQIDSIERDAMEVCSIIMDEFGISAKNLGLTGSILWQGQHIKSDLDITISSWSEIQKILHKGLQISSDRKGFRRYNKLELMYQSKKLNEKSGRPFDECFEMIYQKPYLFYYNSRPISINFVPLPEELPFLPLYFNESEFKTICPITVQAKIISDRWGYYYPGLFHIQSLKILLYDNKINHIKIKNLSLSDITRLLIFEQDFVGYYKTGDIVEIKGLLQECTKIPDFNTMNNINSYQVLLGTIEGFGKEFVRLIK